MIRLKIFIKLFFIADGSPAIQYAAFGPAANMSGKMIGLLVSFGKRDWTKFKE